ncbi:hypothetical protein H1O16_gp290 [Burkholderia phage BcepSaruman]|uniref:Uncharacterized protein n=1 Tax=Burkholderia phage BcepSaruman TaxID=2530032 RepID=A0A4D5ZCD9_9CAUD|nr:hypothetical protein H1O16_gp290 [Burkholderia phage BcepSaruman]QBX06703.1 hypothetical protein BcepSaruman_290 [Burkholderia phage BcepSaruman]
MTLDEFAGDWQQLIKNFVADYKDGGRKNKQTQVRPAEQWMELLDDYVEHNTDFGGLRR